MSDVHHNSSSGAPGALNGPFLTIMLMTSNRISAAAIVVCSALVSYAGATSTISAATKLIPSRPRRIVRSSRVDQPPVSGVPVAGATNHHIIISLERQKSIGEKGWGKRRHTRRVQSINVNAEVDRVLGPDAVADLLDDACRADGVNLARFGDLEAAVAVVFVVAEAGEGGADAGVDVAVVGEQALFVGVVEVGAVVDGCLLGGCAAEDFGAPGVAGNCGQ